MRKSCRVGLYGAICAAKMAARTTMISTIAPATPVRERMKRRCAARHGVVVRRPAVSVAAGEADRSGSGSDETATSGVPNARVERRVDDVDHKIDDHHENGDHQHRALDDRIVARSDSRDDVASHAN